jgi:Tfp pilus assembly protein PilP
MNKRARAAANWFGLAMLVCWLAPAAAAQAKPAQKSTQKPAVAMAQKPPTKPAKAPAQKPAPQTKAAQKPAVQKALVQKPPVQKPPEQKQKVQLQAAKKPATQKPAAASAKKPAVRVEKKSSAKASGAAKTPAKSKKVAAETESAARRRDPFEPLITKRTGSEIPQNLPPGKAGLLIATMRLEGTVHGPNGTLAVVSNPQQRVYFLREGDSLFDGRVEKIDLDGVVFRQTAKDAFGKVVERTVTKRVYPSAGEQQ